MTDSMIWAGVALAITSMLCLSALSAWRGWLELRRSEAGADRDRTKATEVPPTVRIEMADVKERLRKLEAIATGVDP